MAKKIRDKDTTAINYNETGRECVQVKNEDTDWMVYHLLAQENRIALEALTQKAGLDRDSVADSLDRLDRAFLIERDGTTIRALSVGESMLRCQAKYDNTLPYVFENGVVKAKKN
ncbi:hypothetical protein Mboo_1276 [Methanoregula boonei 6A8]|uniref:MarR family transcriptional regulator n=1 Tax=Methanoregula boonei (strain DSM 21154 / JCM 14090 / 6A8) TaxID=456442 RepID=A7I7T3_METB6|nr:hypothetical protein [Methanoregula boonei]ABS55794.1 hypothetical protein Mboo_1276 [Methanoregula boonei 6A8]